MKQSRYARFSSAMVAGGKLVPLQSDGVESVQFHRIPDRLDERRDVLAHARHAADERVLADAGELMHRHESGDHHVILDRHMPGELGAVCHDDAVAD